MPEVTKILHQHDLVRTSCREEIIRTIVESTTPLSEEEIKSSISVNVDRTTFYRTFKILLSKGVIHKIVIDKTLVKYAITEEGDKEHTHAHFYCVSCGNVFCMPEVKWVYQGLPDCFKTKDEELLIKGHCKQCN